LQVSLGRKREGATKKRGAAGGLQTNGFLWRNIDRRSKKALKTATSSSQREKKGTLARKSKERRKKRFFLQKIR